MEGLKRGVLSWTCILSVLVCVVLGKYSRICERLPIHTTAPKSEGDNGFSIHIKGLPEVGKYTPGETYTVLVKNLEQDRKADGGLLGVMMVAVPQGAKDESVSVGNFSVPTHHVKAAEDCQHTVIVHHYLDEKPKIKVDWQAPAGGCVEFRTTVISVDPSKWFKDDGGLTLTLCPEESLPEMDKQSDAGATRAAAQCCACGEARYKMVFEGLWSRQTHPKDFPTGRDAVLLHWSNIIGATHTDDYFIWEYGGYAERGVREVCEYGYSSKLEADMKLNSDNIYTVIKTSPMWRDVTGTRESVFKVNQKAHLLSLLTMVGPSPDWCIGVPSLSMCQANCTWADNIVVELFPWDAGTDDGVTYINKRKIPTDPPDRIHRITNSYPRHPDSPFYGGAPVKPMATVTLTKLREWCDEGDSRGTDDPIPSTDDLVDMMKKKMMLTKKLEMMKCATTEWGEWTECSNNCGVGMRQRSREMENENVLPSMCSVELMEKEQCQGKCMESMPSKQGRDKLSDNFEIRHTLELNLTDPCVVTPWSDWSPCSATQCGRGIRERWRMFLRKSAQMMNCGVSIMEKDVCYAAIPDCRKAEMMKDFSAICSLPKNDGPCRGNFQRWYYDKDMRKCLPFRYGGCRGNDNRFETVEDCKTRCADYIESFEESLRLMSNKAELTNPTEQDLVQMKKMMNTQKGTNTDEDATDVNFSMRKKRKMMNKKRKEKQRARRRLMKQKKKNGKGDNGGNGEDEKIHCMVTEWTEWEDCTEKCGKHYITRTRMIKVQPANGGKTCPKKLSRRRKCKLPKCPKECKVTDWTDWSQCTATCGQDAVRERTRRVTVKPKFGGMDCPSLTEREPCNLKPCSDEQDMKDFMEKMQAHPPYY